MGLWDMALAKGAQRTLIGCVGFATGARRDRDLEIGHEIVVLKSNAVLGGIEDGEGEVFDADIECKNTHS